MTLHDVLYDASALGRGRPERHTASEKETRTISELRKALLELRGRVTKERNGEVDEYSQKFQLGDTLSGERRILEVDYGFLPKDKENLPLGVKTSTYMDDGVVATSYLDLNPLRRREGVDRPVVNETIMQPGEPVLKGWHFATEDDFAATVRDYEELKQQQAA